MRGRRSSCFKGPGCRILPRPHRAAPASGPCAAPVALIVAAWPAAANAQTATPDGAWPVAWPVAILALLLLFAGAAGAGWLLARGSQSRALHDARQRARQALSLCPGQHWQTDARHALTGDALGEAGRKPWDLFQAGPDTERLRAALQQQASAGPLIVQRADDGTLWQLRAAPSFDARGAYNGHLGTAQRLEGGGVAACALQAFADASPGILLVLVREPGPGAWRVLHASTAAQEHFGSAPRLADERLRAGLPPSLHKAFDGGDIAAESEGWQLRRPPASTPPLCLVWQASVDPALGEQASLTYSVSHDLRAPIRVVEGFARIVKEDYGGQLDRVANDHLDRVLAAAARMNQMIDAMLTLARLSTQPLARQPVNLTQLAGFVVDDLRRSAPERQAEVQIEPGMQVQGDPTLLRLVLENLLGNAWKYSARREHTRVEFGRETLDGGTAFVVRDNGAGFDMRSAERLFGLFQRLHSANDFAGTGVGLASVRRIVQRHGGEIWGEGEPGRGAAFFFTLRA